MNAPGTPTTQASARITRGDVQAVLEAFVTGGRVVLRHSTTAEAAPADWYGTHGSIRPFSGSPWDGAHFRASDWHVILIALIEGGDASFTHTDAAGIIDDLEIVFTLDGALLPTTRTAVKRFSTPEAFGLEEAYVVQQGRLMAPGDLAVGNHTLAVSVTGPTGGFQDEITFTIDAA